MPEEQLHNIDEYDLNVVRLCFQAFLPDEHGNYTLALPPLISNPIYDNSKYQPSQMCIFFFSFSLLLGKKNARPVSEVCASLLGHFCGLGLLDACLNTWQVSEQMLGTWFQGEVLAHQSKNCLSHPRARAWMLSQPLFTYHSNDCKERPAPDVPSD